MYNPYILVPLATWAVAQLTKFVLSAAEGNLDLRKLYASGGMPSVHAAVVCSLATTALVLDGASSHLFGFAATFAAIVMYDSLGVRRASGEQGIALNLVIERLTGEGRSVGQPISKLREVLGHSPIEVGVGIVFGIFFGLLFNLDHIGPLTDFLAATPGRIELYGYLALAALVLVGAFVAWIVLRRRFKALAVMKRLVRQIGSFGLAIGLVLGALAAGEYEKITYLAWRLWPLLVIILGAAWAITIVRWARRTVPAALASETSADRLAKWLPKPKRSKKRRKR